MSSSATDHTDQKSSEAAGSESLVRLLREELLKTQLIVLDLNDRVLEKETDKADAVAILGQVELVLEQKINYISELDKALNAQISELRGQLQTAGQERDARDAIIKDLANRLETANQEVSRMHGVAGEYARDLAHTREALARETAQLHLSRGELATTSAELATTRETLARTDADLAATRAKLQATAQQLATTEEQLSNERRRLSQIFASALWRLGRPWRAMFGPKV